MAPKAQAILRGDSSWEPLPWFSASESAVISAQATANLHRGINLGASGGAAVELNGRLAKYLTLDLTAKADVNIELKAQAQQLVDLFEEMGVAIRLRADLEAGASVSLAIGLQMSDFLEAAGEIIKPGSIGMDLLEIFLDEVVFEAGVYAQAAFSAMAYANISCTGNIVTVDDRKPGFYIVGDFGVGWAAGAGYRMFADVGIADPRRWVQRSVDTVVDHTLIQLHPLIDPAVGHLLNEVQAPSKAALRLAFEAGLALSKDPQGAIASAKPVAKELALRCVQIILEEAQRYLLEALHRQAVDMFRKALGLSVEEWDKLANDATSVVNLLQHPPNEPFALTSTQYWSDLFAGLEALAADYPTSKTDDYVTALTLMWVTVELSIVIHYLSGDQHARAAARYGRDVAKAFTGALPSPMVTPPAPVTGELARVLGGAVKDFNQDQVFEYVANAGGAALEELLGSDPAVGTLLSIVAGGQTSGTTTAILTVLQNSGALQTDGGDPHKTLTTLRKGLDWYITTRVPQLEKEVAAATKGDQTLGLFLKEVLIESLAFTVDTVLVAVIDKPDDKAAIREACSAVLLRLLSRSLVITTDVLIATSMGKVSSHLKQFAANTTPVSKVIAQQDVAKKLGVKKEKIDATLRGALLLGSRVFQPLPVDTRTDIREALFGLFDVMPSPREGGQWLANLKNQAYIPNRRELDQLAGHVVRILESHLTSYLEARIDDLIQRLSEAVDAVIGKVATLADDVRNEVESVVNDLEARVSQLASDLAKLVEEAKEIVKRQVQKTEAMLSYVAEPKNRSHVEKALYKAIEAQVPKLVPKRAVAAFTNLVSSSLGGILVEGCKALEASGVPAFLAAARRQKSAAAILDVLADQLAKAIQKKLTFEIPIVKKSVSLPGKAAAKAIRAGFLAIGQLTTTADELLNLFAQHAENATRQAATQERHGAAAKAHSSVTVYNTVFSVDSSLTVTAPTPGAVLDASNTVPIEVALTGVPAAYLTDETLQSARFVVLVNGDVASGSPTAKTATDGTVHVSWDVTVRPGLQIVHLTAVDAQGAQVEGSTQFVVAAEHPPGDESVWGPDTQAIAEGSAAAQDEMVNRAKAVGQELEQFAAAGE
jgi:hypothetical protein